ncbi:MAG: DUF4340 domain-containing protein [Candidatus Zixiibacteriota bacterium]|nr:MAG: DUF4340 domain-containing protein [candidate division Zixibacteria bacterium]
MKRLAIPAVILLIVVAAWLIQRSHEARQTAGRTVENFLGIDPAQIDKVEIFAPSDTFCLFLEGGRWYLDNATPRKADSLVVANVLTTASTLRVGDIISENPEKQTEFQVDDASGILVNFYGDQKLLNAVIIGKPASDYAHTYIRLRGENGVYSASGMVTYTFSRQRTQWLDKTIFPFDTSRIAAIDFIYPDKEFRIERADSIWLVSKSPHQDKIQADSAKARVVINLSGGLRANDFVNATDSGKVDFSNIAFTLKATLTDGTSQSLAFARVAEDAHRHYCRLDQGTDVYVIYSSVYDVLAAEFSSFLP